MSDTSVESCAGTPMMQVARIVGLLFVLLTPGCGGFKPAPPGPPPQSVPPQAETTTVAPVVAPAAPSIPPPPTVATPQAAPVVAPAERLTTPAPAPSPTDSGTKAAPTAKAPSKVDATPAPAAQPPKKETVLTETATPKAPPLDLTSLETRLKDTKAIGVMTKIALKNQVDELLNQFRAFYAGKLKTTLAELRRPYDLLVLKVLSLLQDSDPALASAIVASREAIWGILSDPVKFATI